jgi:hypothetical protein
VWFGLVGFDLICLLGLLVLLVGARVFLAFLGGEVKQKQLLCHDY